MQFLFCWREQENAISFTSLKLTVSSTDISEGGTKEEETEVMTNDEGERENNKERERARIQEIFLSFFLECQFHKVFDCQFHKILSVSHKKCQFHKDGTVSFTFLNLFTSNINEIQRERNNAIIGGE